MHFLVTGGAGFIGSHLCEKLIHLGHRVTCVDNFNAYYDPSIKRHNIRQLVKQPQFRLIDGDILRWRRMRDLFFDEIPDAVIHLAARAGVRPSIKNPRLYQKVNIEGTLRLLELARTANVSKFIMASSSSVYGNNKKIPFSEDDNVDFPISPYAATKKACELLGYTYHSLYQLPVTCLRFFTVYGPRQRPDMAIHKFTRCIVEGRPIPLFGDGNSRRDYTYITDIVDGILKAIEKCEQYHIYNLGESQTTILSRLIALLEEAVGKPAKIQWLPSQPGDVAVTYADISKSKNELGYYPKVPVKKGIPQFVSWYLEELSGGTGR